MHLRIFVIFALISSLAGAVPPVEDPQLLVDIQSGIEASSAPASFTRIDDALYFVASDLDGAGLFRTEGRPGDVVRVATTGEHAEIGDLVVHPTIDGIFLILTDRNALDSELWHVDLVTGEARRLWQRTEILHWIALENRLVFFERYQVWETDGIETRLLRTVSSPIVDWFGLDRPVGGRVYFATRDPDITGPPVTYGRLWSTDGTSTGTIELSPVYHRDSVAADQDRIYFHATSPSQIWVTEGTHGTTRPFLDIESCTIQVPVGIHIGDDDLFFAERIAGTCWLRRIDPITKIVTTVSTTPILTEIDSSPSWLQFSDDTGVPHVMRFGDAPIAVPALCTSGCDSARVELWNDRLLLVDRGPDRYKLWISDGTPGGAWQLADQSEWLFLQDDLERVGDELWFQARSPGFVWHLWRARPGELAEPVSPTFEGFASPLTPHMESLGDRVVFAGQESTFGAEPWVSDGTSAGTILLDDLLGGDTGLAPEFLGSTDEIAVFQVFRGITSDIWATDGTPEGTESIALLSFPSGPVIVGDLLYFIETGPGRLTVSDGTAAGTRILLEGEDLDSSSHHTTSHFLFGNRSEWWSTDGTPNGTKPLGVPGFRAECARNARFCLLFDDFGGVWSTDGTPENTELITSSSSVSVLQPLTDQVVFEVDRGLVVSDGSSAGTRLVHLLDEDNAGNQYWSTTANGMYGVSQLDSETWRLWFHDGQHYRVLRDMPEQPNVWHYFGDRLVYSDRGTVWVTDENGQVELTQLAGEGVWVYEVSPDEAFLRSSSSLWHTDGTAEGTVKVFDGWAVRPNVIDGLLVFHSNGESWRSDGTVEGTFPIWPEGRQLNWPAVAVDGYVVMPWYQPETGEDLYALPKTVLAAEDERLRLSADERFRITVTWRTLSGEVGRGKVVPITGDTGSFWFFSDDNLELMIKVLDGRALN
ncbi:MAG: hypothetical protein AAGD38_23380, partial [Acidobacteriota bacterium]